MKYSDKDLLSIVADERRWCEHGSTYGACSECETACPDLARELLAARRALRAGARITDILESVDNRAMAADGPVTPTRHEMTDREFRAMYLAAKEIARVLGSRPAKKAPAKGKARRG